MNIFNKWFEKKPPITKDKDILSEAYNLKYGDYDYAQDSRSVDKTFLNIFKNLISTDTFKNTIVCGSNSGYELSIIKKINPSAKITAVDISDVSLQKLHSQFPDVNYLHEDLEKLSSLESKTFDLYVSLRAIHSTNIDIEKAVTEATRITKNKIIISISNGYVIDGKLINGMYEYETKTINPEKAFMTREIISNIMTKLGWKISFFESEAELFIMGHL